MTKIIGRGKNVIENWFDERSWKPFPFQRKVWNAFLQGKNGLLNAPTGSGKTFALFMPAVMKWIDRHPQTYKELTDNGLRLLWITPLRALARDIEQSLRQVLHDLEIPWQVARRTGDISSYQKQKLRKKMPEILITTPESMHVLLAQKDYSSRLKSTNAVVVDEWHELLATKRGVQTELALSRLKTLQPAIRIWGISATIGNLDEALEVLVGQDRHKKNAVIVKAELNKEINVQTVIPDEIETFPWSGHLGTRMMPKVIPVIDSSQSTLIFTNTRSQAEIWFQKLLNAKPELAGSIALHHGSLSKRIRNFVEQSLREGSLKAVVCTSSLDLGVDFTPVETVIQVGSPKGLARFLQRAGRSGHQPGAASRICFVPTNALELIEASALREAVANHTSTEKRQPVRKPYDVLVQYLVTLAVSEGFDPGQLYREVKNTYAYHTLSRKEWEWVLDFITTGGTSLMRYDEYSKVKTEGSLLKVKDRNIKQRHRMCIGTITSDTLMQVKYRKGASLGYIEEWFVSSLKPGDTFWFAGRSLELIRVKNMTAYVRRAGTTKAKVPSWLGGRLSLSSNMSDLLRQTIHRTADQSAAGTEIEAIKPLLDIQGTRSHLPEKNELLIEKISSREGCHVFVFPFEGRQVHEGLSALIAYRISQMLPITFSIAMNDYGFELLSDRNIPIEEALGSNLFSNRHLLEDIFSSLNSTELARRRFREIGQISGLVFPGYPGRQKDSRHLQMSSGLFFDVFEEYEPDNLLLQQAYNEVLSCQLDEHRLRKVLKRIRKQTIRLTNPESFTPFAFPIMVDRLRERLSSEQLMDRIQRMQIV